MCPAGGAGCEPAVPMGMGELSGEARAGLSEMEGRAGSRYTTAPQHGNLRQQPLAWNIIKYTQVPRNRNATN